VDREDIICLTTLTSRMLIIHTRTFHEDLFHQVNANIAYWNSQRHKLINSPYTHKDKEHLL
jgi:hypothetical protein